MVRVLAIGELAIMTTPTTMQMERSGRRYVLDRRLGCGGMAEVFLAHAVGPERAPDPVAIKRLRPGLAGHAELAGRFAFEARIMSSLAHPNVVTVQDFDHDAAGLPCLVMELVDGPSLAELMATARLPRSLCVHLAIEVLRGLDHAHRTPIADCVEGVVHRDVSPHNVLISWQGAVKLGDFGLAKACTASASVALVGKPSYMSPEQTTAEPIDGRSDLFAVGVMLWEMLCGTQLFSGRTTYETLARVLFSPIPSPSEQHDVPEQLAAITMKLLARDRDDRYDTAQAAIEELIACDDHEPGARELLVELLETRFTERARRAVPMSPQATQQSRLRRVWRWPRLGGAAFVAAIVAALGFSVT